MVLLVLVARIHYQASSIRHYDDHARYSIVPIELLHLHLGPVPTKRHGALRLHLNRFFRSIYGTGRRHPF